MNAPPRHSPAAERNRGPILAQLLQRLPAQGTALEIAAGSGQHAAHFAPALPGWRWWPTDADAASLASIDHWCAGLANVAPAQGLDVASAAWGGVPAVVDLVYCANMVHVAPWAHTAGLMQGAARHLAADGLLVLYGPFLEHGVPTAAGNLAFDAELRARVPAWGLRRREDVEAAAAAAGLRLAERVEMPANNLMLFWRRA